MDCEGFTKFRGLQNLKEYSVILSTFFMAWIRRYKPEKKLISKISSWFQFHVFKLCMIMCVSLLLQTSVLSCVRDFLWKLLSISYWNDFSLIPLGKCASYAAFRLTCRLPHCRFDDDICTTAQAPLAAEGWPSGKQRQAASSQLIDNLAALPTAADRRQLNSIQLGSDAARW